MYYWMVKPGAKHGRKTDEALGNTITQKGCHQIIQSSSRCIMQMNKDSCYLKWRYCEGETMFTCSLQSSVIRCISTSSSFINRIVTLHVNTVAVCVSYESLHRRRLGDAPHLHPRSLLLLPAGTVGAVGGAAI